MSLSPRQSMATVKIGPLGNSETYTSMSGLVDKFFTYLDLWVSRMVD